MAKASEPKPGKASKKRTSTYEEKLPFDGMEEMTGILVKQAAKEKKDKEAASDSLRSLEDKIDKMNNRKKE